MAGDYVRTVRGSPARVGGKEVHRGFFAPFGHDPFGIAIDADQLGWLTEGQWAGKCRQSQTGRVWGCF